MITTRPPAAILLVAGLGLLALFGASLALARPTHLIVRVVDTAGPMAGWDTSRRSSPWSRPPTAPRIDVTALGLGGDGDLLRIHRPEAQLSCGFGNHAWFARARFDGTWGLEHVIPMPATLEYTLSPSSSEYWFDPPSATARRGDTVTFHATRYPTDTAVRLRVFEKREPLDPSEWCFQPLGGKSGFRSAVAPIVAPDHDGRLSIQFEGTGDLRGWVAAAGYRPLWVTASSFEFDGAEFAGEVVLERGFWARLILATNAGHPVREGLEVVFDGDSVLTQRSGLTAIESDESHPELRIEVPGHAIIGGDVARDGTFAPGRAVYLVQVEPEYVSRLPR